MRQHGIEYYILTNDASRSPELLSASFNKMGYSDIPPEKFISSGMLAKEYIRNRFNRGKIAYLGTQKSASYIADLGLDTVAIDKVQFTYEELDHLRAIVLLDDDGFNWQRGINNAVNILRIRNIPVVVANPDMYYPVNGDDIAVAIGGVANLVEKVVGKKFIKFGKPDVQIFNYAFEYINNAGSFRKNEILMVGDTLTTDIIGAHKFGLDTALVLTGNTIPDQAEFLIKTLGIVPDYICESIAS